MSSVAFLLFYVLYIFIKIACNDNKSVKANSAEKKPIEYLVNGRTIKPNWYLGYYHQVLNIPKQTPYFNDRVIEDCYWLSLSPDKDITPAIVADKKAARQYLLDRIHYMHSLN